MVAAASLLATAGHLVARLRRFLGNFKIGDFRISNFGIYEVGEKAPQAGNEVPSGGHRFSR